MALELVLGLRSSSSAGAQPVSQAILFMDPTTDAMRFRSLHAASYQTTCQLIRTFGKAGGRTIKSWKAWANGPARTREKWVGWLELHVFFDLSLHPHNIACREPHGRIKRPPEVDRVDQCVQTIRTPASVRRLLHLLSENPPLASQEL